MKIIFLPWMIAPLIVNFLQLGVKLGTRILMKRRQNVRLMKSFDLQQSCAIPMILELHCSLAANWRISWITIGNIVESCLLKQKISFISIYIVQQVRQERDASFKEDKPAGSPSKARGADPADGGLLQGLPGFCFCLFSHPPAIHSGGGEN